MKKGKEIKNKTHKDFTITYGTVNNNKTKAIYISFSSWAEPRNNNEINYSRVIRDIDKKIRQRVYNLISSDVCNPFLKNRTILDYDIKESGVKFGKRSFSNGEIILFLKEEISVNSERLKPYIEDILDNILEGVLEKDKNFKFFIKKR